MKAVWKFAPDLDRIYRPRGGRIETANDASNRVAPVGKFRLTQREPSPHPGAERPDPLPTRPSQAHHLQHLTHPFGR